MIRMRVPGRLSPATQSNNRHVTGVTETLLHSGSRIYLVPVPRKFVAALVALIILAPPLLACALPGVQMSDEEKACCRHMADECGSADMPDSHSCCKKSTAAQTGSFQMKQCDVSSLEIAAHVSAARLFLAPAVPLVGTEPNIFFFPESPPGHTSVLRI